LGASAPNVADIKSGIIDPTWFPLVRVRGVAPLDATVYEFERLRCNLCGTIFSADAPPNVGQEKYDETAAGMIALLKHGVGCPSTEWSGWERTSGSRCQPPHSGMWSQQH